MWFALWLKSYFIGRTTQIVKKYQTTLSDEIEQKTIAHYSLGMSYKNMTAHLKEIYGLEISSATLSNVTDKIIHTVKGKVHSLELVYPIVWLDATHYKIRDDGKICSKVIYTILGMNFERQKEVLGLYLSESEGANFWLQG